VYTLPPFPGLPFPPCLADMGGSGGDVEETNAAESSKVHSESQEEKRKKRKKKLGWKRKKKLYSHITRKFMTGTGVQST